MGWLTALLSLLAGSRPAGSDAAPAAVLAAPPPPAAEPAMPIRSAWALPALDRVLIRLGTEDPAMWASLIEEACRDFDISTPRRMAAFLANTVHESNGFRRRKESMSYSAARMCAVWPSRFPTIAAALPLQHNPKALAERVYGGRMGNGPEGTGDGHAYIGRGLIQVTGRNNYREMAAACGIALSEMPSWMETRRGAATSAAAWWSRNGLNPLADTGDIAAVRKRVNGGAVGLKEVAELYEVALQALEAPAKA